MTEDIPPDAKDLIIKLLKPKPEMRIGNGSPESKSSIEELKKHSFFDKIDFEKILTDPSPIDLTCMRQTEDISDL